MNDLREWLKSRKGSVLILTVAVSMLIIGMTALVTDVGWVYYNQARLETAVNAGWKAGFDYMKQLQGDTWRNRDPNGPPLSAEQMELVRARVREVAILNGLSQQQADSIEVVLDSQGTLEVRARHEVGLFFARVVDNNIRMGVASKRTGAANEPVSVLPFTIPHGIVKDLTRRTYDYEPYPARDPNTPIEDTPEEWRDCEQFQAGQEYILKLGEGEGSIRVEQSRLLVPMDSGSQSIWGFRRAYGAVFWCLAIDESDVDHYGPVHWLLGYRGGAFLLIDAQPVRDILENYGVNYQVISGNSNINAIYDSVGDNVMEIWNRPRVAVYSSTSVPDPVETTLRNARIPYGPYSLPGQWPRGVEFDANNCASFYNEGVLSGEINKYHWLHLHHEDFTGFSGGCRRWKHQPEGNNTDPHCRQNYLNGTYGPISNATQRAAAREFFCDKCFPAFNTGTGEWHTNVVPWAVVPQRNAQGQPIMTEFFGYASGTTYNLKNAPNNGGLISPGNFGALDLNPTFGQGGGANNYRDNIRFGYGHTIAVGQRYFPQTGNITGPTGVGVDHRLANNLRYVTIPVVDGYGNGSSQRSTIIGFLRFELLNHDGKGAVSAKFLGSVFPGDPDGTPISNYTTPYIPKNCRHYKRRCAEFATHVWWKEHERIKPKVPDSSFDSYMYRTSTSSQVRSYVCYSDDTRPNCRGTIRIHNIATNFGYTDEPGSVPKPQADVLNDASLRLGLDEPYWFNTANRVQLMKWDVARIIKDHVNRGGFLFAQCFAPETLDLALFQGARHIGMSIAQAYNECLAFQNFEYRAFPYGIIRLMYSSINTREAGNQPFNLLEPHNPMTQNHAIPDTGSGHTAAFVRSTIKPNVTVLGVRTNNNNWVKYLTGNHGKGVFTFLGGHHLHNVQSERLVLNNVLFGSISSKNVSEGAPVNLPGRTKHSYGPVDPDNSLSGESNDYLNRLLYGFNSPLQINDRVNVEPGNNFAADSVSGVTYRVTNHGITTSKRVIVPISDIGDEIHAGNNAGALTIYDMKGRDDSGGTYGPPYDFSSSVRLIGFAEFELILTDPDIPTDPNDKSAIEAYYARIDAPGYPYFTRAVVPAVKDRVIEVLCANPRCGKRVLIDPQRPGLPANPACKDGLLGSYQSGQIRGKFIRYIIDPNEIAALLQ